ncbi:MAG: hypothetical protein HEQ35_05655 [Gloeotrichia echinulata IR180]
MKNQSLYEASLKILTKGGVPEELSQQVSKIVANDEAGLPNLGRSPEDQQAVNAAMAIFWDNEELPDEYNE